MTFDEATSVFVLVMAALLLGWRYRPRVFFGRLVATIGHLARFFIMSRSTEDTPRAADTSALHVPVPSTDTSASTTAETHDITDDWEMPRVGRRLSDGEIIALLAAQRGADGKYRFSANAIYDLVKGPRAEVLNQVRAIREGPPAPVYRDYPPALAPVNDE